jgi:N-acetylglucosaminyl-diphospho-decaprenol L-rhamnosyltransferase
VSDRDLLVVNFRSAALTAGAIRSARPASSTVLRIVVVDNSCDEEEARALRALDLDELIISDRNRGYAGAINLAFGRCTGKHVIVSNPDVEFRSGAIDRLCDALRDRVALAGPLLSWDARGEWILPPAEISTRRTKLRELLSSASLAYRRADDRRRTRARIAFWSLAATTIVPAVSGAVMAIDREAASRIGGFDERYPLYFEEIDFMRRLRRAALEVAYIPAARCHHAYNQTSESAAKAGELYAEAESVYHARWSGAWFLPLAHAVSRRLPAQRIESAPPLGATSIVLPGEAAKYAVEASPLASFTTAAGVLPTRSPVEIAPDILRNYRGNRLFFRIVERESGAELERFSWENSR